MKEKKKLFIVLSVIILSIFTFVFGALSLEKKYKEENKEYYALVDHLKNDKDDNTCQWAGCDKPRKSPSEYCSYHSNHLKQVNDAVTGN